MSHRGTWRVFSESDAATASDRCATLQLGKPIHRAGGGSRRLIVARARFTRGNRTTAWYGPRSKEARKKWPEMDGPTAAQTALMGKSRVGPDLDLLRAHAAAWRKT